MTSKRFPFFVMIGLFFLAACGPKPDRVVNLSDDLAQDGVWPATVNSTGLQIGFDPRLEPKEDVRQVASLAGWLEKRTGLFFDVYIPGPDENIVDNLCTGKVDFAVVGTVSYLQAHEQCGAQILVRGLNSEGKDSYRAAIVVATDSPLQTLHAFKSGLSGESSEEKQD